MTSSGAMMMASSASPRLRQTPDAIVLGRDRDLWCLGAPGRGGDRGGDLREKVVERKAGARIPVGALLESLGDVLVRGDTALPTKQAVGVHQANGDIVA